MYEGLAATRAADSGDVWHCDCVYDAGVLWSISRTDSSVATNLAAVATKYYTHFVTGSAKTRSAAAGSN